MYKFKKLVLALGLCGAVATGTAAADMKVGALFPFSGALALLGQEAIAAWSWPSTRSTPRAASTARRSRSSRPTRSTRPRPCPKPSA